MQHILRIKDTTYDLTNQPLVMGILNRTPDSFFDKGKYFNLDSFLKKAQSYLKEGADIIDVGGVRAGPGKDVTESEELDRVLPAIELLKANFDLPISVDTFRASVLKEALKLGASIGNDISGFADPDYLKVASEFKATVVATHIRLAPRVADPNPVYFNLKAQVLSFLDNLLKKAHNAGVDNERIIVDPGLDLGKTTEGSVLLSTKSFYNELLKLGRPILLSASRKDFLGNLFSLEVTDRKWPSVSMAIISYLNGARIFRVHDVFETKSALNTLRSIKEINA